MPCNAQRILSNKNPSCPKPILPLINNSKSIVNERDRTPGHRAMGCHNLDSAKSRAYALQGPAQDTASLHSVVGWGSHNPTGAGSTAERSSASTPAQWRKALDLPPREADRRNMVCLHRGCRRPRCRKDGKPPLKNISEKECPALGKMGYRSA